MTTISEDYNPSSKVESKLRILQGELALHIEYSEKENRSFHEKLDMILEQTRKTNGRVTHMEAEVHRLDIQGVQHLSNCPNAGKIEEINRNLLEYAFFKKHPQAIYLGILAMVVSALLAIYTVIKNIKGDLVKEPTKQEQTTNNLDNGTRIAYSRT